MRFARSFIAGFCTLVFILSLPVHGAENKKRWEQMEYGPYISGTFEIAGNFTLKGLLVRADKDKQAYMLFDEETMRMAGAWDGGFIDWRNVIYNGEHHAQPKPKGIVRLVTQNGPGWAKDGSFEDPRKDHNGNLGLDWLKYRGLYVNGQKVILSYTVGETKVLEMPSVKFSGDVVGYTRNFTIDACNKSMKVLVCESGASDVKESASGPASAPATLTEKESVITAGVAGAGDAKWDVQKGRIALEIPAHAAPINVKLVIARSAAPVANFAEFLAGPEELSTLTKGGAPNWPETVHTEGKLGTGDGAYVVDTITAPDDNPWNSWMRFGGFDFFADGKRAAVCTWSGDVWIVSGIDESLKNLTWKRFATGLYQPLGLKIVDDVIYTTCRDQITRLHDLNNDGEADFYECFNGDCLLTRHFHEFAHDLQTDSKGNFYYAKGSTPGKGGPNFDLWSFHSSCFLRVSKDGSKLDVVARGLRAPNGIAIGPNDEMTCGDNEGSWVPSCPINLIKEGGFVGIPDGVPGDVKPTKRDDPICWIPWQVDNSSGAQVWVAGDKWGPFKGHMLHLSYGTCSLFHVMTEKVGTTTQGGVAKFPLQFNSGVMRARFHPGDGQLYGCGLKGWQTTAARDGIFQRVRYTGKPIQLPYALHVTKTGVDVTFTNTLDPATANDPENYACFWFNVLWTKFYGSDRYSPTDPSKKYAKGAKDPPGDTLAIKSVKLQPDGKTVSIELPGIKPVTNMVIRCKIKAADGSPVNIEINNTINQLPE